MIRWFLAVAASLGAAISVAHADYVRIIYNLGVSRSQESGQPGGGLNPGRGPGGMPGMPGGGGLPRGPGMGAGGGGMPGMPGGGGAMPGMPGGGGGMPGMPGGGGGMPGMPGGGGGMPGMPGGAGGMLGGGGMGRPNPISLVEDFENWTLKAEVVVEYHKANVLKLRDSNGQIQQFPRIFHKWGATGLMETADIRFKIIEENGVSLPPVKKRYETKSRELLKDGKAPDKLLDLAEWALNHGLIQEFTEVMDDLVKVKPDDPAAKAYQKVQADLTRKMTAPDNSAYWQDKLGNFKLQQSAHYALLYNIQETDPPEVEMYIKRLEENYRAFFYWFTLKAQPLPVPDHRLVAVLVRNPEEFRVQRQVFDSPPLEADGFFVRRDSLAVFSAMRQDEAYTTLTKNCKDLWSIGWNRDKLLEGKGRPGSLPQEIVKNQMIALLLKAMQEESIVASVSHVATRQLAQASGLLPRAVAAPQWIQFGLGSFFETPEGAYWPGSGAPNWIYLVKFKLWQDADAEASKPQEAGKPPRFVIKLLDPAQDALRMVVTDEYFRNAASVNPNLILIQQLLRLPGAVSGGQARIKAQTMSWALTYFLVQKRMDGLLRYFEEVNSLPRDLELDDDTLMMAFARAFDMVDSATPNQVNTNKFNSLAKEWYEFIHFTPLEVSEAYNDAQKELKDRRNKRRRGYKQGASASPTKIESKK